MSLTRWVTVHCDAEGCVNWDSGGGGGLNARDARARAKAAGWVHTRDGRDLCWDHKDGQFPDDLDRALALDDPEEAFRQMRTR